MEDTVKKELAEAFRDAKELMANNHVSDGIGAALLAIKIYEERKERTAIEKVIPGAFDK